MVLTSLPVTSARIWRWVLMMLVMRSLPAPSESAVSPLPRMPRGHDALAILLHHPLDAVGPVGLDGFGVANEAPLAGATVPVVACRRDVSTAVAHGSHRLPVPLRDSAHHRCRVRGAHHDAVCRRCGLVLRV